MALQRVNAGTNEDGSPHWLYVGPDDHVVYTGPYVTGAVEVDGELIDVSPNIILAKDQDHAMKIAEAIGARFEAEQNHPMHTDGTPFVHDAGGKKAKAIRAAAEKAEG